LQGRSPLIEGTQIGHDFLAYRGDALRAWQYGWGTYYSGAQETGGNVNPPLQGLMTLPFLPFSPMVGYLLWVLVALACLVLTWWLTARDKWWQLLAFALIFPVGFALVNGQVVFIVVAILALAWWLSERGRGLSAGLVLSLATVKPQLIFLLPLVLLLAGKRREFVGFVIGVVIIAGISIGLIGVGGLEKLVATEQYTLGHLQVHYIQSTMILRTAFPGGIALTIGAVALALWTAWRLRGAESAPIFAVGILASWLTTPYINATDFVLWILIAWWMQRSVGLSSLFAALGVLLFAFMWPFIGSPLVALIALILIAMQTIPARTTQAPAKDSGRLAGS
jgi:hypothetical protein